MAIFAGLFAYLGRFVGRILTMAFSWATVLLFGRVPQSRQLLLSVVALGSIVWVATVLGVIFPELFTFALSFVTIPAQFEQYKPLLRVALFVAAMILPLLIGIAGLFLVDPEDRPSGTAAAKQVLRGYPYAAVLAFTLVFMIVIAPIRKLRSIAKRWTDAHIPVVVKPHGYDTVASDLEAALDRAGLGLDRRDAPRVLEAPSKLLGAVAGAGVKRMVPDRLMLLANKDLEVLIYPSDISVSGKKDQLARARAAVASRLVFTAAYLTSTKDTQLIEERLERVLHSVPSARRVAETTGPAETAARGDASDREAARSAAAAAPDFGQDGTASRRDIEAEFSEIDQALATLDVEYDEWEVIYRMRLQVERDILSAWEAQVVEEQTAAEDARAHATPAIAHAAARVMGAVEGVVKRSPLPKVLAEAESRVRDGEDGSSGTASGGRSTRREPDPLAGG